MVKNAQLPLTTSFERYDTGSIGAITLMPYFEKDIGPLSPIMRGFTVSLIMLAGAVPSFFAGQLADRFGRLSVVCAGSTVFLVGAISQGAAYGFPQFWVGRALCGLGEGLWLSNVSVSVSQYVIYSSCVRLTFW